MFTLLPPEYKIDLMSNYRSRLYVVLGGAVIASVVFSIILLLPTIIFLNSDLTKLNSEESSIQNSISRKSEDDVSVTLENFKRDIETVSISQIIPSPIVALVFSVAPTGVDIETMEYRALENKAFQIMISGTASTRQILDQFTRELKKEEIFSEVNLPISNLAKDTGAKFNISIKSK